MATRLGPAPRQGGGHGSHDVIARRLAALSVDVDDATRAVVKGHPDGVHDLRVATRRLRSCLRTFRPLLDRTAAEEVRAELKWIAELLGAARDPEVLARRLERHLDSLPVEERMGPVRRELVGGCQSSADEGRADVITAIESDRYRRLLGRLDALAAHPPYRDGRSGRDVSALLRCVRKEVRRVERRVDRALAASADERDAAYHNVRKASKRVRYAAETIVPVAPAARRMARRYEAVQDLLGERQDAAVARRLLAHDGRRVGVQPAHNGFTYGVLAERERHAIQSVDARWPRAWRRTARSKVHRFLAA